MRMQELVLAVGFEFERVGLSALPQGRTEPILDPAAVWRIPPGINVVPIPPPIRKIRAEDLVVLNHRRAGSRGKANVTQDYSRFWLSFATIGAAPRTDFVGMACAGTFAPEEA